MNRSGLLTSLALFGVTLCLAGMASADSVETHLAQVMTDAKAHDAAIQAGRRASYFCANCHGETGISTTDYIPNLAGHDPLYLLNQIDKFGDGRRKDDFMSGLVKLLKPEERFDIAVFYASQSVPPIPAKDAALQEAGRKHYLRACAGCHGPKARGTREIPRVAGQQRRYVMDSLANYRAAKGARTDPRMTGVAKQLSNRDIEALATYLSSLP